MRDSLIAIVILTGLVACEWNSDAKRVDASTQPRVDSRPMQDGDVDADPTVIGHLLLTEIALQPTAGELVEITNPTTEDISLADYYLADNGDYWRLPAGVPAFAASDFIIAFPAAATIPAGGSITIAMGTAAAFMTTYGSAPTYSIADATVTRLQGAGTPSLTDGGEIIALFHWDGAAGLVADVDIMIAGGPTMANSLVTKSGVVLGSSTYAADADTIQSQTATAGNGVSTKRILAEAGHETEAGTGNGIDGDDETSEDTRHCADILVLGSVTVRTMRVGAWVAVVVACGMACGPTAAEIKTARAATYEVTPREVYAVAEKETAGSYPIGERMPDELVFATVPQWFTDRGRQSAASDDEQKKAGNMQVSFAVLVTAEGSGSKVLVTASAVDYVKDKPDPKQLDETALPKWLNERTDKLRVQIHKRVQAMLSSRVNK